MEDVLEVYKWPYDPKVPVICLDETNRQLIEETRRSIPAKPGRPKRTDYEYRRKGVVNAFMMFEPLKARRHVRVTDRRTRKDWAECVRELVDVHYPQAEQVVLVEDNLNTHSIGSLYEAFPPTGREAGAALYSQAWKLVEHGRDRDWDILSTVFIAVHLGQNKDAV